jgi:hypothetical protein
MLHTYCDVVEQITVRLVPYVAIATNPCPSSLRHAVLSFEWPINCMPKPIIVTINMINDYYYYYFLYYYFVLPRLGTSN